jgi:hypothetical protein
MRSGREPLLPALAGFLVGVLFTLAVIQFESTFQLSNNQHGSGGSPGAASSLASVQWTGNAERYTTLTILLALAITSIVAYLRFAKAASTTTLEKAFEGTTNESPSYRSSPGADKTPASPPPPREGQRRDQVDPSRGGNPDKGRSRSELSTPYGSRQPNPTFARDSREPSQSPVIDYDRSTPPQSTSSYPNGLVEVWDSYFKKGDGRFNIKGLQKALEEAQIPAEVLGGEQMSAGENLLIVDFRDGSGLLHILPNFSKPTRALETWFHPLGSGARTALIQRLVRPATARRKGGQIVLENRGEIE